MAAFPFCSCFDRCLKRGARRRKRNRPGSVSSSSAYHRLDVRNGEDENDDGSGEDESKRRGGQEAGVSQSMTAEEVAKEAEREALFRRRELKELTALDVNRVHDDDSSRGGGGGRCGGRQQRWYLIGTPWLQRWLRYAMAGGPPPGPVDNATLLTPGTGNPRPGLVRIHHYRGINGKAWSVLCLIHGGGPAIVRDRLNIYESGEPVEVPQPGEGEDTLIPATLHCLPYCPWDQSDAVAAGEDEEEGAEREARGAAAGAGPESKGRGEEGPDRSTATDGHRGDAAGQGKAGSDACSGVEATGKPRRGAPCRLCCSTTGDCSCLDDVGTPRFNDGSDDGSGGILMADLSGGDDQDEDEDEPDHKSGEEDRIFLATASGDEVLSFSADDPDELDVGDGNRDGGELGQLKPKEGDGGDRGHQVALAEGAES